MSPTRPHNRCEHCNGAGPTARVDWHRFLPSDACPDCGVTSQAAPPDAESAHVDEVLDQLREVLLSLPEDDQLGALASLERRAQELDPRRRPVVAEASPDKHCPVCDAESRPHRYSARLMVCTALSCGALWSRNRRGQVTIEPVV